MLGFVQDHFITNEDKYYTLSVNVHNTHALFKYNELLQNNAIREYCYFVRFFVIFFMEVVYEV